MPGLNSSGARVWPQPQRAPGHMFRHGGWKRIKMNGNKIESYRRVFSIHTLYMYVYINKLYIYIHIYIYIFYINKLYIYIIKLYIYN